MLGNDNEGPAKSKASARPLLIPAAMSPCSIGISVKVAKYMNAPTIDAKRLENNELPPTNGETHSLGIIPGMLVLS